MVRTGLSLVSLILCAFFLTQTAHAQEIAPRSYLFVEVADETGTPVDAAAVRLSNPDGKEIINLKTDRRGHVSTSFYGDMNLHHYDLQVSKSGHATFESVLFPNIPHDRYFARLSDEFIPSTIGARNYRDGPPVKVTLRKTSLTPAERLLMAVKRGDAPSLGKLLQQGVDRNATDNKGVPAVAWATFAGDPETIKLLLDAGADVKSSQPLLLYLGEGVFRKGFHAETIDRLITAGADVNASNSYHGRVLNKAITQVPHSLSLNTVNALIKAGADVNAADSNGQTPLMLAVYQKHTELFDVLLNAGAKRTINAKNKAGWSALMYAAAGHQDSALSFLKILLSNGANATDVDEAGVSPLMLAAKAAALETVQTLLNAGASIGAQDKEGQTALMYAVKEYYSPDKNVLQIVKLLLNAGEKINAIDGKGRSALICAVQVSGDLELVNLLIENGANVNLIDKEGRTALLLAVQGPSIEIVKTLLKAGASSTIDAKDKQGRSPLLYAAEFYRTEQALSLIAAGATVDIANLKKETPLILAVQRILPELVKQLLAARASVEIQDHNGYTALMYAKAAKSGPEAEIFDALINAGARPAYVTAAGETPLFVAAGKKDNLTTVRRLLHAADVRNYVNFKTKQGQTALINAATYSDPETVAALLEAGAHVHEADLAGQTALMRAVTRYESSLDIVKMLIKAGANVNAADAVRRTPLLLLATYPSSNFDERIFKELLDAGANINAADASGNTVLMSIVQRKSLSSMYIAIAAGASVNAKDSRGRSTLAHALSDRYEISSEIVRGLITAGANVNDADANGQTPLILAAHKESSEAVKLLVAAGANVNAKDRRGQTALMRAAIAYDSKDSTEVVKTLIAAKANINDVDQVGQTALMFAAHTNFVNTVQALLDAGASIKMRDREGKTALLHATDESRAATTGVVKALLAAGATVNEVDGRGQTPLMLASLRGASETVATLLNAGASVNVKDSAGMTALMFASWGAGDSSPNIAHALLKAGAKVNDVDKEGKSALMFAAQHGLTDTVRLLLGAKASINARDISGDNALDFAMKGYSPDERKAEVVKLLVDAGASQ